MADGVFGVEIVTPEQSLFAGGATSIVLATSEGALTVLDGHTPLVGDVVHCEVKVEQAEGTLLRLAVHGGFLQVDTSPGAAEGLAEGDGPLPGLSTRVTVLAGVAELASEIDVPRAEQARERAAQRVSELGGRPRPVAEDVEEDVELAEAEGALARAELRHCRGRRRRRRLDRFRRPDRSPPLDSAERDGAELRQLGQRVAGVDLAQRPGLGPHDQRLRRGPELVVLHALEQLAVGDAGGGEEAVVPLHQIVGREHGSSA